MPGTYFDGDHETPTQHGPIRRWRDDATKGLVCAVTFRIREPFYDPATMGSDGSAYLEDSYLVQESEPSVIGADVVEFTRLYAQVPDDHSEPLAYVYDFLCIIDGSLTAIPMPLTAKLTLSYYHTATPFSEDPEAGIVLLPPTFRAIQLGGGPPIGFGTAPANGDTVIAEQEQLRRVYARGHLYEKRTITVVHTTPA